ncbi:unnamed protein product [Lymnaea stagnalis]|uniref:G-protein coupled receptors family 1 profile domain-containing protein n=1 Tax=Lymnaea stagnalis TaxID=6523 RepID=A0AAV2I3X3_LYMST
MTELFTPGPYTCGDFDPTTDNNTYGVNLSAERLQMYCIIRNVYGLSTTIISLLGIVGNIFCLVILPKTGGAKSAIVLLYTLGLYDTVFLLSAVFLRYIPSITLFGHMTVVTGNVLSLAMFPVCLVSHFGAVYTTVAISIERCLAITSPFRILQWFTSRRIKIATLCILVWSIAFNIPRFLLLESTWYWEPYLNRTWIRLDSSDLSLNVWLLKIYFGYLNTLFKLILPILLVVISNTALLCCLRKRHSVFVEHVQVNGESARSVSHSDGRVTPMVLAVTWTFVLSHSFAGIQVFYHLWRDQNSCTEWCITFDQLCDVIFALTSATNFLLYYAFGIKFRKLVKQCFNRLCTRSSTRTFRLSSRSSRSKST